MSTTTRPPTPRGTWRLGRAGGVDLLVKPSLLLMGVVLVALFAPQFDRRSDNNPYVLAITFVLALYLSVLVHELAHVAVARGFRMRVRSVTLHLLGGETLIEGESRSPWQELATSVSGPLASLAIGWSALAVSGAMSNGFSVSPTEDILWLVGSVNVILAVFNMLPGLPLDGGRAFRALVWWVTGREETGIRVAAWLGRLAAVAVVTLAVLYQRDDRVLVLDLLVAALVAWFLWQGASDALRNAAWSARVNQLDARAIARVHDEVPADAVALSADLRGADLLRAMSARPAETYVLTEPDGSLHGVLTARDVDDAYRATR